jgi:predicted ABC-type ATPase
MEWRSLLEARPVVVAVAGSNGAGKTTFFHAHLADTGLRFVNADELALEMGVGPYEAAELAASLRAGLVGQRESFVFETVLSDPVGARVSELAETARHGIHVVMVFIRIDSPDPRQPGAGDQRVASGGHFRQYEPCPSLPARSRLQEWQPYRAVGHWVPA